MKYILLSTFALLLTLGQILFKKSALAAGERAWFYSFFNGWFLAALILYAIATVLWVLALRYVPLSLAYPFAALAFVLVPLASFFFFHETLSMKYMIGCVFIILGILLTAL